MGLVRAFPTIWFGGLRRITNPILPILLNPVHPVNHSPRRHRQLRRAPAVFPGGGDFRFRDAEEAGEGGEIGRRVVIAPVARRSRAGFQRAPGVRVAVHAGGDGQRGQAGAFVVVAALRFREREGVGDGEGGIAGIDAGAGEASQQAPGVSIPICASCPRRQPKGRRCSA